MKACNDSLATSPAVPCACTSVNTTCLQLMLTLFVIDQQLTSNHLIDVDPPFIYMQMDAWTALAHIDDPKTPDVVAAAPDAQQPSIYT